MLFKYIYLKKNITEIIWKYEKIRQYLSRIFKHFPSSLHTIFIFILTAFAAIYTIINDNNRRNKSHNQKT